MSKRILLISHCFAPQNKIGAVRPTKLAKYLGRMGYQITVLSGDGYSDVADPLLVRDLEEMTHVHVIKENSLLRKWKNRKAKPSDSVGTQRKEQEIKTSRKRTILNFLYLVLANRADRAFARECIQKVKELGNQYDVVLSTYGPPSVHTVGCYVKRNGYAKRWIADFRDIAEAPLPCQKFWKKRYMHKVNRNADIITAISKGTLTTMGLENKGQVIYNGFDGEDMQGFTIPAKRKDKLTFVHFGQMYGMQRDLSPFFNALSQLIQEGKIDRDSVALCYAGRDTRGFVKQATDAGLQECLEGYAFMPRDESIRKQKSSHILLLPSWNMQSSIGNIPGKLLEYMMLDMPVICCVSGDVPNSEMASIIRRTSIGICYEQTNYEKDAPLLKQYLLQAIESFQQGQEIPYQPNKEAVQAFTYESRAKIFADIIENWK